MNIGPRSQVLEYAVDILYNEFLVRREIGEAPTVDEYRERFPELVEQLQIQINLRDALGTAIPPEKAAAGKQPRGYRVHPMDASIWIRDFGRTWPPQYGRSARKPVKSALAARSRSK